MRRNSGIMATRFYFLLKLLTTDNERIIIKNGKHTKRKLIP